MIRGVKIDLGGHEYELPSLNLDQLEEFELDIAKVSESAVAGAEAFGKERLAAMARVIHAALTRNYPELVLSEVRKGLDLANVGRAWAAVMGVSGLLEKESPTPAGEAKAEAAPGTTSAQASAAEPAGPGATQGN